MFIFVRPVGRNAISTIPAAIVIARSANMMPDNAGWRNSSNIGSVWYNVDKYYTLVSLCGLGNHPTITSNYGTSWTHPGPLVEIQYRNSSNNGWYTAISKDFTASEIGKTAGWHYWGGTGVWNFDWRTRIGYAELNDKFDIGHAVEDLGY